MKNEIENNELMPKKITFFDKIKNKLREVMGYREGKKFIIDIVPQIKKYSDIELMQLANIEKRLKEALDLNNKEGKLNSGIERKEAEKILEWVVQNDLEGLTHDCGVDAIKEHGLLGYCGLSQGISGFSLINMGLSPYIGNVYPMLCKNAGRHAFLTVEIPVKENGKVDKKLYLIDATYLQFFLRNEVTIHEKCWIKDKRYGNRVAPLAGYWLLQTKEGNMFAKEILSKGFIELNEKNAKLYGDSFTLEAKKRKNDTKVPRKNELNTGISGQTYIQNMIKPEFQEEIDYYEREMDEWGINIKTPLMMREDMVKNNELSKGKTKEKVKSDDFLINENEERI